MGNEDRSQDADCTSTIYTQNPRLQHPRQAATIKSPAIGECQIFLNPLHLDIGGFAHTPQNCDQNKEGVTESSICVNRLDGVKGWDDYI